MVYYSAAQQPCHNQCALFVVGELFYNGNQNPEEKKGPSGLCRQKLIGATREYYPSEASQRYLKTCGILGVGKTKGLGLG